MPEGTSTVYLRWLEWVSIASVECCWHCAATASRKWNIGSLPIPSWLSAGWIAELSGVTRYALFLNFAGLALVIAFNAFTEWFEAELPISKASGSIKSSYIKSTSPARLAPQYPKCPRWRTIFSSSRAEAAIFSSKWPLRLGSSDADAALPDSAAGMA